MDTIRSTKHLQGCTAISSELTRSGRRPRGLVVVWYRRPPHDSDVCANCWLYRSGKRSTR